MAPLFPAVFIGGPARSGKSTLTYRLSQVLRRQATPHYALRASPDGDGDWLVQADQALVAELRPRARTGWTPSFAASVARDIAGRHLPLIVDAGGRISPETEMIAARCTHAVLVSANQEELAPWRELVTRRGLVLLAELQSVLVGQQIITAFGPPLRGTIVGLSRSGDSAGPCFTALAERLTDLFAYTADELFRSHLTQTDIELVLHLEQAIYPLPAHITQPWRPEELPILLPTLPSGEPLAIYGRGPAWLYAALAVVSPEARCQVFDPRQGWVEVPRLERGMPIPSEPLEMNVQVSQRFTRIRVDIQGAYLDRRDVDLVRAPDVAGAVVLDGRLPTWLWAALVRCYQDAPWVACFQPQLSGSVVVSSRTSTMPIGTTLPN